MLPLGSDVENKKCSRDDINLRRIDVWIFLISIEIIKIIWSKVLELKMAGFIRTSSIKVYVNSIIHFSIYYFIMCSMCKVHFMSNWNIEMKKKKRERHRRKTNLWLKLIYSNCVYLIYSNVRFVFNLKFCSITVFIPIHDAHVCYLF